MSAGEINTSLTGKETHSLDGNEVEDVNNAATSLSVPITSKEVGRQIRVATDPLTKQLEMLFDLMREIRWDTVRRDEGTSAPAQGPSGPRGGRYENSRCIRLVDLYRFPQVTLANYFEVLNESDLLSLRKRNPD